MESEESPPNKGKPINETDLSSKDGPATIVKKTTKKESSDAKNAFGNRLNQMSGSQELKTIETCEDEDDSSDDKVPIPIPSEAPTLPKNSVRYS